MKPSVPVLARGDYFVADVPHRRAVDLVVEHHYARGASNTSVYRHGLFRHDDPDTLRGVALWLPPTPKAARSVHEDWRRVLSLTRLVVVPGEPQNAASYLLGQSVKRIRRDGRWAALVTYADEGEGHTGAIYKATNWEYLGPQRGAPVWRTSEGRHVALKAGPRSRTKSEMEALGYIRSPATRKHKYRLTLAT